MTDPYDGQGGSYELVNGARKLVARTDMPEPQAANTVIEAPAASEKNTRGQKIDPLSATTTGDNP
jgi:hypothetical protein